MSPEAWFSVAVVAAIIGLLATNRVAVEFAMLGGLVVLIFGGAVEPDAALAGFGHPAVVLIGSLFVVAAGLNETGATRAVGERLLGRPTTIARAQIRLMAPVAALSAFMNNTPIVAMYLPIVNDWARRIRISPSKLMMPLSFAAILGGQATMIGSASNLVVMGLYQQWAEATEGVAPLASGAQFWGPAAFGIPGLVLGLLLIIAVSPRLLPERRPVQTDVLDARRYTVRMAVRADSPIVGKSIEEAGLRHLPGLYLVEIEREDQVIPAPPPEGLVHAGDTLAFAGILESVVDLRKIRGLVPATNQVDKIHSDYEDRTLVEAVVSHSSPLASRTVRETLFRTTYNAAIIAVHRNGEQIQAKVGDIRLQPGDTLLLDTHRGFLESYRDSDHFYLVSAVADSTPVRHDKAWIALSILAVLVMVLASGAAAPAAVGLGCAVAMVVSRCVTAAAARQSLNLQVLIVIAAALGIGRALDQTGAAEAVAAGLLDVCGSMGFGPRAMLFATLLLASGFAQLITNNGAAALMFPVAMATARELGVNPEPFMFTLMFGCGLSFLTPIAYQTNLMVYGPGGYRFTDFTRMGAPLTLLMALIAAVVGPWVFGL